MPTDWEYRKQTMTLMRSYRSAQVLITCAELGIFEAIDDDARTAQDLAAELYVDAPALARLMNAAVALGFLEKRGNAFVNSPAALACLAHESPAYIGNLMKREAAFHERWTRLSKAVRTGRRPEENTRDEGQAGWVRSFELALRDAARPMAPLIAEALAPLIPTRDKVHVIDVGGGHGMYSITLAQRYPNVHAIVFDLPPVAEVARAMIDEYDLGGQVTVQAGDFKMDMLGEGFDLALLFGVLVSETPQNSIALLHSVHRALAPGGSVVIRGQYLAPDRTGPLEATLFDLQMLLFTEEGQIHTSAEVTSWLDAAGFAPGETIQLSAAEVTTLLTARRSA